MTGRLPGPWRRWQHKREAAMIAGGVRPSVAADFAACEAQARTRIAKHTGFRAAAEARLIWDQVGDRTRFLLVLDPCLIPPGRRAAAHQTLRPGQMD